MTAIRSASELPTAYRTLRRGATVPDDLRLVCLWSAFGLTLTGLFFASAWLPILHRRWQPPDNTACGTRT